MGACSCTTPSDLAADGSLKVLWDSQRWNVQFPFNKFNPPVIDGGQIYGAELQWRRRRLQAEPVAMGVCYHAHARFLDQGGNKITVPAPVDPATPHAPWWYDWIADQPRAI